MDALSHTAQWTAAVRALENDYGKNSLFQDHLAHMLAEPMGFKLMAKYSGGGVKEFIAIRTSYFDDLILKIVSRDEIRQVVMVAAGMDTRAFRLSWPGQPIIFEIDRKPLLNEKRTRLSTLKAIPNTQRIEVPTDLTTYWLDDLMAHGFDCEQKTLWIAEGLFFYLTKKQVEILLETLARASMCGSMLVADMISLTLLQSPMTASFLAMLKADGAPWQFGTDEPEHFLQQHGWRVQDIKEPGQTTVGLQRWPYRQHKRTIKRMPRNWLIHAEVQHRLHST